MRFLRRCSSIASWVFLCSAIISAPLFIGSTRPVLGLPAFWPVVVGLAFAAGLFAALRFAAGRERIRVPWIAPACVALLAALAAVQSVPLPRGIVEIVSPERARQDQAALEGLALPSSTLALSVAPDLTAAHAWKWAGYAVAMTVAAAMLRRRRQARIFLLIIAGVAVIEALLGMTARITGWSPLGLPDVGRGRGTFVNPNNFAGFLGLGLFVTLGLVFDQVRRMRIPDYELWRARFSAAADAPDFWKALLLTGGAVVIAAGLIFSQSRGGLLAACGGFVVFALMIVRHRGRWLLIPALGVLVAAAYGIGVDPINNRMEHVFSGVGLDLGRPRFWSMALDIAGAHPVAGAGLGAFVQSRVPHWPADHAGQHALYVHNDYLDILSGGGFVGATLLLGFLAAVAWVAIPRLRNAQPLLIGTLAALAFSAFHAFVDFDWHIPGVAIAFFALAGVALSPAFRRREETWDGRFLPPLLGLAAASALVALLLPRPEPQVGEPPMSAARSLAREPHSGMAFVELGWEAARRGDVASADRWFIRARRCEPCGKRVLGEAREYWLKRIVEPKVDAATVEEFAAASGPALWSGIVPAKQLLKETLDATKSSEFLDRLLPPVENARRPAWQRVIDKFKADSIR